MGEMRSAERDTERVKALAGEILRQHYVENNLQAVVSHFDGDFLWIGAGEHQRASGLEDTAKALLSFQGNVPPCILSDEQFDVTPLGEGLYLLSGVYWVETAPGVRAFAKEQRRISMIFRRQGQDFKCVHIHNSNPHEAMGPDGVFPDRASRDAHRHAHRHAQRQISRMKAELLQRNKQMEVIMKAMNGGLKVSRDEPDYPFDYVSPEGAALFGYTVEEFLEYSSGSAAGAVYPPDLKETLKAVERCFQSETGEYAVKYRVRCKDGSLKWILDSGKKFYDEKGNCTINSLYLDITESENIAQRIRGQKELLDSIYDTVTCGIMRFKRVNGAFRMISINRAMMEIFGYGDLEECMTGWKDGVLGNVLDEDRASITRLYGILKKPGESMEHEYRARLRDGSLGYVSAVTAMVSRDEEGEIFQRTAVNITERKRLQQQIAQDQEMYRVAMEGSSDVLYEYRLDEDLLVTYQPQTGAPEGEGVRRRMTAGFQAGFGRQDFIHPDDVCAVLDSICEGRGEVSEVRMRSADTPSAKDYRWYRITGKRIELLGQPRRVVGTIRDIHEEKQTLFLNMEELHMSQSAFQAIKNVYTSIFYLDLARDQYYMVRMPEAREALLMPRTGCFSREMARYVEQTVPPEQRGAVAGFLNPGHLKRCLGRTNDHIGMDFQRSQAGNPQKWTQLEAHLISLEQDQPHHAVLTFRDITGERLRELEYIQEEKKAKEALEQAYQAAQKAGDAKSEFLSRMSHDIRTPINAILGMTTIAQHHLRDEGRIQGCLEQIRKSSELLLSLINEVLDMTKIESGAARLNIREFSVRELLRTMEEMVLGEARNKGHQIEIVEENLLHEWVKGDFVRLQQVFLNLLTNAIKYTPDNGRIRLKVKEALATGSEVGCYEFCVEDNGIGMSAEFLKRVFGPFERSEDERVRRIQGTGLGMAIADNLVRMMDGSIRIESRLNQGTRVRVTLYLPYTQRERPPVPEEGPAHYHGERILLVEDNDLNREIARELLAMLGLLCDEAGDGSQAVERIKCAAPGYYRMVLMDIQMPVMDGYQAARAIRALERPDAQTIPIIALTANAFADDVYKAMAAGMNEHIPKPIELGKLGRVIQKWMGGGSD